MSSLKQVSPCLLDGDGFGEVAGHVGVVAFLQSGVVRQKLQRNSKGNRREYAWDAFGDFDVVVGEGFDVFVVFFDDGDYVGASGFHLHDVADEGPVGFIFWAYKNHWEPVFNKADWAMFAFTRGERDGWDVSDFHKF